MAEDDYLVEIAWWVRYHEWAHEQIRQIRADMVADPPPQEIVDNPKAFNQWVEQCNRVYLSKMNKL